MRHHRPASCISAAYGRPCTHGFLRASMADDSFYASKIPTRNARSSVRFRTSLSHLPGSVSNGMKGLTAEARMRPICSPNGLNSIARMRRNLLPRAMLTPIRIQKANLRHSAVKPLQRNSRFSSAITVRRCRDRGMADSHFVSAHRGSHVTSGMISCGDGSRRGRRQSMILSL